MEKILQDLEEVRIVREENGGCGLYVNGEKIDTKNTLGIHLDIRYDDDELLMELTTRNRVCILNYGERLDVIRHVEKNAES